MSEPLLPKADEISASVAPIAEEGLVDAGKSDEVGEWEDDEGTETDDQGQSSDSTGTPIRRK